MSVIRFKDFELDQQTLELRKSGSPTRIQQQPARVLAFLLNHRGSLVTREQIRLAIWGEDTFVDFEQGLNFCIRQIRLALNDQAEKPSYVETLPRLGYRFVAEIEKDGDGEKTPGHKLLRVAVVPVEDLSGKEEDYFAAGLTEDMISALSRIDPARLRVTSVPKLEGGDASAKHIDRLQHELNLDYLLRGSVRRSGDTLRISAQLHDLRDKSVLWSETYDRKSADLLAVQEEVTQRVSRSLALELFPSATVGSRRYSRSSAAYDAYLKGRFFWHKMTTETILQSMACFNQALALDARFAPAYAGLADCYAQMGSIRLGLMKPLEAMAQAHSHLQRALDLDETLAEAHCTLGLIKSWYDWDWDGAGREFQAALALDPSQITALIWQSLYLSAVGRAQDAIGSMQRAREIEPLSIGVNLYLGVAQTHAGQYDLAIRQLQQCVELEPGYYRSYFFLGRNLAWLGRYDEAVEAFEKALSLTPDSIEALAFMGAALAGKGERQRALNIVKKVRVAGERTEPAVLMAAIYARLGLATEMYDCLERGVAQKSAPMYVAVISQEFYPYRTEARFHSFLASIGLSQLARN
ncbi:MAG TPA: tetratricopeptide repeat protein [Terracidiphilus sp.]|jgi:TolB-like protein/Tfp pilus assembly protein PilF|nr:tetratricopeptide repeat protein [Terracidiphilus sp.]